MKIKTTCKEVEQRYKNVIQVLHYDLQSMLCCETPIAYTTRAEGWGADIYAFGDVAIVTGYAPFGGIRPTHETNQRYEKRAREITTGTTHSWQEKKTMLAKLIDEYIEEVLG